MLKLLKDAFPNGTRIPYSHYEAKKKMNELGLGYENIHVCMYDCALFWEENVHLEKCPICNEPRYQMVEEKGKKVAHKVMRYFSITPHLKCLYGSRHITEDMRWHNDKRLVVNGVLRHPTDGECWRKSASQWTNLDEPCRDSGSTQTVLMWDNHAKQAIELSR